ncbi:MAG: hypothetical protein JRJ19_02445 [Deltaproteobacteria bacterium]|nr:hypothetical protein [Deltaproteobacteria bacterium]
MKDAIKLAIREIRQTTLAIGVLSVLFLFGCLAVLGDLNDHLFYLGVYLAAIFLPMLLCIQSFCKLLLKPVQTLSDSVSDGDSPSVARVVAARQAVDSFSRIESVFTALLWVLVGFMGWIVLVVFSPATGWQVFVLGVVVLCVALLNFVFGSIIGKTGLISIKQSLEPFDTGKDFQPSKTSRLSTKLVVASAMILFIALTICSLIWFSSAREQTARKIIAEQQQSFRQLASRVEAILTAKPDAGFREALRQADSTRKFVNNLVVLDRFGKILLQPSATKLDPVWFDKIFERRSDQWHDLRTPFLYLVIRLSHGQLLAWVAPMSIVYEEIGGVIWHGLVGVLLLIITCLLMILSVSSSTINPIKELSKRLGRFAKGDSDTVLTAQAEEELVELIGAIRELTDRHTMVQSASADKTAEVLKQVGKLVSRVTQFKKTAENRTETAEQTATSVTEMRSAIQSITEQMDALREASSDCSSSMFEIDQSVREVAGSAENLQNLVEDTASAMTEISVSMDQVVSNVDDLAKSADETLSSLSVVDGSIKQVEESTAQTHRLSEQVSELASRGASSVSQTIEGINEIQEITDEAQAVINRLGTQMEAVGKILTVIGDVAEQTNLLALNAAIIAAAAGEHGKGFAVVADEIKDLADRTSSSTKEIAGLIRSVQSESRLAIDAMQRGSGSVRRGVELANTAGTALQQILESVRQVTQRANDIATSTAENSSITRMITRSMTDISSMVREIKRAVAEQSKGGSRVSRASEQMRDDARFVYRSANEQVQAAAGVNKTMESISEMVSFIGKAMIEQANGVNHVARVAEEVRDSHDQERAQIADLEETTDLISIQARDFANFIQEQNQCGERE